MHCKPLVTGFTPGHILYAIAHISSMKSDLHGTQRCEDWMDVEEVKIRAYIEIPVLAAICCSRHLLATRKDGSHLMLWSPLLLLSRTNVHLMTGPPARDASGTISWLHFASCGKKELLVSPCCSIQYGGGRLATCFYLLLLTLYWALHKRRHTIDLVLSYGLPVTNLSVPLYLYMYCRSPSCSAMLGYYLPLPLSFLLILISFVALPVPGFILPVKPSLEEERTSCWREREINNK